MGFIGVQQQSRQVLRPGTEVAADVVFLREILVGLLALTFGSAGILFTLL
jgi:hypothetical protein